MHPNRISMVQPVSASWVHLSKIADPSTFLHDHVAQKGIPHEREHQNLHTRVLLEQSIREVPRVVDMLGTYLR
jgi:hypothetical protein